MSPLHPETPPLVPLGKGHQNTGLLTLNMYMPISIALLFTQDSGLPCQITTSDDPFKLTRLMYINGCPSAVTS